MITQELLEQYSQDDTGLAGAVQILAEGVQLGLQAASRTPAPGAGVYALGKMPADNTKTIVAMVVHTSDIVEDAFLPYFDANEDLGMEPGSICDMLMRTGNPHGKGMLTIPDDKLQIRPGGGQVYLKNVAGSAWPVWIPDPENTTIPDPAALETHLFTSNSIKTAGILGLGGNTYIVACSTNLSEKQVAAGKFVMKSLTERLITPEYADEWYYVEDPETGAPWIAAFPFEQVQAEIIAEAGFAWGRPDLVGISTLKLAVEQAVSTAPEQHSELQAFYQNMELPKVPSVGRRKVQSHQKKLTVFQQYMQEFGLTVDDLE